MKFRMKRSVGQTLIDLDNPIDRNYFDETIEIPIQNRKIKLSCW